jgi:SET and MYND domain-containing protein 5
LVSTKKILKNEEIYSESPLISSQFAWNEFYKYKACEYCMRPLETAQENVRRLCEDPTVELPYLKECCLTRKENHCQCSECGIEYCSVDCQQKAFEKYHNVMCFGTERNNPDHPYNVLLNVWRQIHLPTETTTINLVVKLIATVKQVNYL